MRLDFVSKANALSYLSWRLMMKFYILMGLKTVNPQTLTLTSTSRGQSLDLIGSHPFPLQVCTLSQVSQQISEQMCDFNFNSCMQAPDPYPSTLPFKRSFWIYFPNMKTISTLFIDSCTQVYLADVYVSYVDVFTRNDPYFKVLENIYPSGIFQLPVPRRGKFIIFMPQDDQDAGKLNIREIRVWQDKEISLTVLNGDPWIIKSLGPNGLGCINMKSTWCTSPAPANYNPKTKPFAIDIGSKQPVKFIWILFGVGASAAGRVCIGHQDTQPLMNTSFLVLNKQCFNANDHQEHQLMIDNYTRYIYICAVNELDGCIATKNFYFKKIAVFINQVQVDPCVNAFISSQTIQPAKNYVVQPTLPNPQVVLEFNFFYDNLGVTNNKPLFCGMKKLTPDKTWATVLTPADPVLGKYQLIVNTNIFDPAVQNITISVAYEHPSYTNVFDFTVNVTFIHPCKNALITSNQIIQPIQYIFGEPQVMRTILPFANSVNTGYGYQLCGMIYKLEPTQTATDYGVNITPLTGQANWEIKVNCADVWKIGTQVQLSVYGEDVYPQIPLSQRVVFSVEILSPCPLTTIQFSIGQNVVYNYILTSPMSEFAFTLAQDTKSQQYNQQISQLCGQFVYEITSTQYSSWVSVQQNKIRVYTQQIQDVGSYQVTMKASLISWTSVQSQSVQFTVNILDPCLNTSLSLPAPNDVTLVSCSGQEVNSAFYPATDSAATAAGIPALCGQRVYWYEQTYDFLVNIEPQTGDNHYNLPGTLRMKSNSLTEVGAYTVTLWVKLQNYPSIPPVSKPINVTINHACVTTVILNREIPQISYQIRQSNAPTMLATFFMNQDSAGIYLNNPMICGVKTYNFDVSWLLVQTPDNVMTDPLRIFGTASHPMVYQTTTVNLRIEFLDRTVSQSTLIQQVEIKLMHPCTETYWSTSQTIPTLSYIFGDMPLVTSFADFDQDLVSQQFQINDFCQVQYEIIPFSTTQVLQVQVSTLQKWFSIRSFDRNHIGQTFSLQLRALSNAANQSGQSTLVGFDIIITDPCPLTVIQELEIPLNNMEYVVRAPAVTQNFAAVQHTKAILTNIPDICGPVEYSIIQNYSWARLEFLNNQDSIAIYTDQITHAADYSATFQAKLVNYSAVAPLQVMFQVKIINPCLTTTLHLWTTFQDIEITSLSGTEFVHPFAPATDSASQTAQFLELCGSRIYSIVEQNAQNFVSIVGPTNTYDQLTQAWQLKILSNSLADVGNHIVTLKAVLQLYPSISDTKTISVQVNHICFNTVILSQPMLPSQYTLEYSVTSPQSILDFQMHRDTVGNTLNQIMICGTKTYSTGLTWLSVMPPSNPQNQNFQLMVATNAISLVGSHSINLVVGFSLTNLSMTLTETFTVTLRHPCIKTAITSTQIIPTQRYYFGDDTLIYHPQEFINTVATEYGIDSLCAINYQIWPSTSASAYGVSILSLNQINIRTTNQSLIGTSVTLELRGFYQSYQNNQSVPVQFTVEILDSCPNAVIYLPQSDLLNMTYTITQTAAVQSFSLGYDSKSIATSIPNLCGPISYSIIQDYSFVTVQSDQIIIQTNKIQDAGQYTATFQARLVNYSTVSPVYQTFQISIIDPCLTTTLTLPTVLLSPITITAMSGQSSSQIFVPAQDSASNTANDQSLCGLRTYQIVEQSHMNFARIEQVGSDPYVDNLRIIFQSFSMNDRGSYQVILRASLSQYSSVQPATRFVELNILDPCLNTVILPEIISDMSISIYDITPKNEAFVPFKDTQSNFQNRPNFCGPISYAIENPTTWLASTGLNSVNILPWTVSAVTNDIGQVGTHFFSVRATLDQYPSVSASYAIFNLIVIDNCESAIINSQGQQINDMAYYPLTSLAPSVQKFLPFSDSVAQQYSNPQICGAKTYKIAESLSFISITPPLIDPFTNEWNLTVESNIMSQIGIYTATVVATLDKYHTVAPATLQFKIYISHPCDLTVIKPQTLTDMSFTIGFVQTVSQIFPQFKDEVGEKTANYKQCGERIYRLIDDHSFLNLQIPVDPWNSNFSIELFTLDSTKVGQYTVRLEVKLVSYSLPKPQIETFRVTIKPKPKNNLPYFQPKLSGYAVIKKTDSSQSWKLQLPEIVDLDNDPVTTSVDFGLAESFLQLDGKTSILCNDISQQTQFSAGMYLIKIMLNDQKDVVTYNLPIYVDDLQLEVTQTMANNEASTNEANEVQQLEQQIQLVESIEFDKPLITDEMTEEKKEAILTQAKFDWQAAFAQQKALEKQQNREQFYVEPKPFFKDFKPDGQVILGFKSDVYIVPNLQMINNGTIYLEDFYQQRNLQPDRNLAVTTTVNNKKKRTPVLKVEVLPGSESNPADLQFSWNVTQQASQSLHVQLYFENPYLISSKPIPDKVKITFNDPTLFVGTNGKVMDAQSQILERYLPNQVPVNGAAAAVAEAFVTATGGAQVVIVGNFFLNLLMSASLNQLWSMINTQQLIVIMPLFKVQMPASATSFFNQILKIASFDVIDLTPRLDKLLHLNATEPLNPNFDALGFGSLYFLNNMNSMLIGFLVYFSLILLLVVIDPFQKVCRKLKVSTLTERLRSMLFYNFLVSMMAESYSLMSICTMIGLSKISFSSFGEIIQTVSCLSALVVLIIYPLFIVIHTIRCLKNAQSMADLVEKYQTIFEEVRTDKGQIFILHHAYFLIRRFLTAVIVVVLRNHLIFQVMLKAFTIIAAVMIAGETPFNRPSQRKTEFFNETIIMLVLYTMICFSPFVPSPTAKQVMGYFCCLVVACHLFVNLYLILGVQVQGVIGYLKLWLARRKLQQQRDRNSEKIKQRKHIRKEFQQLGIIFSDESQEIQLSEPVEQPSKRHQQEPIEEEEEEKVSQSEIQAPVHTLKQGKAKINQELLLLEKLVNDHFAEAERQERELQLRSIQLQPDQQRNLSLQPQMRVNQKAKQEIFAHPQEFKMERMNAGKSKRKNQPIYDLDFLLDIDEQFEHKNRKKQKRQDSESQNSNSGTIEDVWNARNGLRNQKTELVPFRNHAKARALQNNRNEFI